MISVIIPAYNSAETLRETVMSVLNQTYKETEVIIVNDGSEDGTQDVINLLAEQYPDTVKGIQTENNGVTSARLTGILAAKGEWIGFLDSDDLLEEDMYEILLKNAEKYEADISHCGYQMISANGEVRKFYGTERLLIQNNLEGIEDLLNGDFVEPSLCNKLFHSSLFSDLIAGGLMDNEIKHNEDLLMNYYLFRGAKRSVFHDVCKYHYMIRQIEKVYLKRSENKIYDPIKVREIILSDVRQEAKKTAQKVYLRTCIYVYNSLLSDSAYVSDRMNIRQKIIEEKRTIPLLSRKLKVCALMIVYSPFLYKGIYRFYEKHLLKSKYL